MHSDPSPLNPAWTGSFSTAHELGLRAISASHSLLLMEADAVHPFDSEGNQGSERPSPGPSYVAGSWCSCD